MYKDLIERLGLTSTIENEKQKFCVRMKNAVEILDGNLDNYDSIVVSKKLAFKLGIEKKRSLLDYFKGNFEDCIIASELLLHVLIEHSVQTYYKIIETFIENIKYSIDQSLTDLGIDFDDTNYKYIIKGEEVFDQVCVIETLKFMNEYPIAKELYSNALTDLLIKKYEDATTKAYSALESIVKTICENDKTLENNIDNIQKVPFLTSQWKSIFVNYCKYAHEYSTRHGKNESKNDFKSIKVIDVESYIYITGILIRLLINSKIYISNA